VKIIGVDNFGRETVADRLLVSGIPNDPHNVAKAEEVCDWFNTFSCCEVSGGTFHRVVDDGYRLSRGMEDLV
jgi:hypothetical protein